MRRRSEPILGDQRILSSKQKRLFSAWGCLCMASGTGDPSPIPRGGGGGLCAHRGLSPPWVPPSPKIRGASPWCACRPPTPPLGKGQGPRPPCTGGPTTKNKALRYPHRRAAHLNSSSENNITYCIILWHRLYFLFNRGFATII
jgi:hypothetical protein